MGASFMDIVKDNKKPLLSIVGVMVMAIIIGISVSQGGVPNLGDSNINNLVTDGSLNNNNLSVPTMQLNNSDYSTVLKTNYGDITIDLFEKDTPVTVNNFVVLSNKGFYNNLTFHRIIKGFVIQGGDPLGNGTGGPGYKFEDEIDADALGLNKLKVSDATYLRSFYSADVLAQYKNSSVKDFYTSYAGYKYTKGYGTTKFQPYVVAMANSGPDTNGSQFFITSKTFSGDYLNGKHTIFGRVTAGFDVVDSIENVNVNANGQPTSQVKINSVEIVEK